jgi:hypothetical protein
MRNRAYMIIFWLFFTVIFILAMGTQHFLDAEEINYVLLLGFSVIALGFYATVMKS